MVGHLSKRLSGRTSYRTGAVVGEFREGLRKWGWVPSGSRCVLAHLIYRGQASTRPKLSWVRKLRSLLFSGRGGHLVFCGLDNAHGFAVFRHSYTVVFFLSWPMWSQHGLVWCGHCVILIIFHKGTLRHSWGCQPSSWVSELLSLISHCL